MKAKLSAFLQPTFKTLRQYPERDLSIQARYARAVAYYRRPQITKALPIIDGLIKDHPNDPFFHELRGQMLFENGRTADALPSYEQAARLLPTSALLKGDLARVQMAMGEPRWISKAATNFRAALNREPRNTFYWRQLGIAYGKLNRVGESSLALAEEAVLRGQGVNAQRLAERAKKSLPPGSPDWIRAEDILASAKSREPKN